MKNFPWLIFAAALAMMGGTVSLMVHCTRNQHLGQPGVKVGPVPMYGENHKVVSSKSVILPEQIQGGHSQLLSISDLELKSLPGDTTFGRRLYQMPDGFQTQVGVVLMGSDRASIHQPQYCLAGQGWTIQKTEAVKIPIGRPYAYDLPALKITASNRVKDDHGHMVAVHALYVYWFVNENQISAGEGTRLFSMAKTLLQKDVLERWAYVSYLVFCAPGREEAAYERLEKFIQASVPEFQVVAGQPRAAAQK